MRHRGVAGVVVAVLMFQGLTSSAGAATPLSLTVPQSTAFSYLGHSCGGIQEQAYATGWDPSGYPTGDAYLSTRCGGSGRGGGYRGTTYAAWVAVTWDFGGGLRSTAALTGAPTVDPAFSATDANGDQLYNASAHAYLVVAPPGTPTVASVVQVGDQFQVAWTTPLVNPLTIASSTITATPVNAAAPTLTAAINGSARTGLIGPLQPSTTYRITVVNTTAGGTSAPSSAYLVSSHAATTLPGAPTGVAASWTSPGQPGDMLAVTWAASVAGDSPTDGYQIVLTSSDGATVGRIVSGTVLSANFSVNDIPDWRIVVRAHNAVGWGPWSAPVLLGGT